LHISLRAQNFRTPPPVGACSLPMRRGESIFIDQMGE
jgi:hypothetical protein